jgi:hypothetical protein
MPKAKKTHAQIKEQIEADLVFEGSAYLNPNGTVDGETLLEIVRQSPGVFSLLVLSAVIHGDSDLHEDSDSEYHRLTEDLISGLAIVIERAAEGDERAAIQLKAIEKLIKPEKFELRLDKIKELLIDRYETSPMLARGWELRRLMSGLLNVVEPVKSGRPGSINAPIRLIKCPVYWYYKSLWEVAQKHWKPKATLQSLAIRIYLEDLQDAGVTGEGAETITTETLKRDLERARTWEQDATEDEKRLRGHNKGEFGDSPITWFEFSEGWKVRKVRARKKATGSKQRDKLS